MSAKIIDGKQVSANIKERIKKEVAEIKSKGVTPGLAVVIVGETTSNDEKWYKVQRICTF